MFDPSRTGRIGCGVAVLLLFCTFASAGDIQHTNNEQRNGAFFMGPGTLTLLPQFCVGIQTDTGLFYALENLGGFDIGDRVYVSGMIEQPSNMCFPANIPALIDAEIQQFIEQTGTISVGPQGCPQFAADSGNAYFIEDTGKFTFGDRVYVTGAVNPESLICAPVVGPGLENTTIEGLFEQCGELGFGPQGCLTFFPEDGENLYFLTNFGGFVPGDTIFVQGIVDNKLILCFPIAGNAIDVVDVDPCTAGDVTGDTVVNIEDLLELLMNWGACDAPGTCPADLDDDGVIGVSDLLIVLANWTG